MPKRTDINRILLLGSGPIVIGQACEFDYSGVQACKALREEGYYIILVNSNPATIMTDPDLADVTYIEAITWRIISKIIEKERPDALLCTMGGQTALNCALDLDRYGILKKFNVITIGATIDAIYKAEDRQKFRVSMENIGLEIARSDIADNMDKAMLILKNIGLPCIIRPSFTLGGTGGGIASTTEEFKMLCKNGFNLSPNHELLIDESLIGWKEYEMEVIRDIKDNCIIICSIENIDPMGIHTGDSITVAPAQTLTDKEYQIMRNAAIMVLREIGIATGGANVQFAVHPKNGKLIVVEMNPRVSRSSALASKATGFPIAKIAAKLAIGYTLDELSNDITNGRIPASFEPSIDYVVTKIPRFNFEKFPGSYNRLTTQMKSVGEVMAIGRSLQESLQKAIRGLEIGATGFNSKINLNHPKVFSKIAYELRNASNNRIWYIADAFRYGMSVTQVFHLTKIDRWFLSQIQELIQLENEIVSLGISYLNKDKLLMLKKKGFSDARLGQLTNVSEDSIRVLRYMYDIHPVYKHVDACAAEFSTDTSYMYSTYDGECEFQCDKKETIMILGGGPNRIGQGIEFDYCCVHAAMALRESGYHVIMVNCNPETVSTDYDISDVLYFEPITLEDILEIARVNKPIGVIVQYGGQTPLKLAKAIENAGISIIGTHPDAIDQAENRERFKRSIKYLGLKQPNNITVTSLNIALSKIKTIGYPVVIRPSYVLGGRAMKIVYNEEELLFYFRNAVRVSHNAPVLLEHFLDNAIEVDIDAICDGKRVLIGGIMEHIEHAGIHSGDSACSLPAHTLNKNIQDEIRNQVKKLAFEFRIKGLVNIQLAVQKNKIYIIEINPRASRTIPFVSKATGIALAKIGTRVMIGQSLLSQGIVQEVVPPFFSVKEVVLPFNKFINVHPILGPEMRSTGEVMGIGRSFEEAFAKATLSHRSIYIKKSGCILLLLSDKDMNKVVDLVTKFLHKGFMLDVTYETAKILKKSGIESNLIQPIHLNNGYVYKKIKNKEYIYVIDTNSVNVFDKSNNNSTLFCQIALKHNIHYGTTVNGSFATANSLLIDPTEYVISVQDMHLKIMKTLFNQ
ncbi:carbamoyl-phosphate synthase large subunit [Candidatus Blochmannia ocreatus (nom. nud.)]|uniref:Carbamoyl phosphate synthase large chain n=1 Tax=Candidatus Blochmannia ocreatus (nom. nud.) TaxID=251538 RepID=A0ABY4ST92_9ENTR|nr:carbamoyl-phosphate synthase large subunit [Candidatus Blochmannia ocreatus]URJ25206.1 carbamoyl-phosphate synthase large subunit [Candidatus Blochmannia ocreatus]